jgi:hypothetical protein
MLMLLVVFYSSSPSEMSKAPASQWVTVHSTIKPDELALK